MSGDSSAGIERWFIIAVVDCERNLPCGASAASQRYWDGAPLQTPTTPRSPPSQILKKHDGAAAMRGAKGTATIRVPGVNLSSSVEVIDEDRTLTMRGGSFVDEFAGWGVHIYKLGTQ